MLRRYTILKVRMKISFMALQQSKTVKELFFETIMNTYLQFSNQNRIKKFNLVDNDFFEQILNGRINLKIIVYRRVLDLDTSRSQVMGVQDEKQLNREFIS